MMTIWKSQFLTLAAQTISLPQGAVIRHVAAQNPLDVVIWYECDPTAPKEDRTFKAVPTGGDVPARAKYLGTCLFERPQRPNEYPFVVHVYELL